jgi:hypothetical protein
MLRSRNRARKEPAKIFPFSVAIEMNSHFILILNFALFMSWKGVGAASFLFSLLAGSRSRIKMMPLSSPLFQLFGSLAVRTTAVE